MEEDFDMCGHLELDWLRERQQKAWADFNETVKRNGRFSIEAVKAFQVCREVDDVVCAYIEN